MPHAAALAGTTAGSGGALVGDSSARRQATASTMVAQPPRTRSQPTLSAAASEAATTLRRCGLGPRRTSRSSVASSSTRTIRSSPRELPWPELDAASVAKLRGLPFWDEAIRTERRTGAKVTAYAAQESPPLLREAVALQGYEETRHAALLDTLIRRYDIHVDPGPEQPLPAQPRGGIHAHGLR